MNVCRRLSMLAACLLLAGCAAIPNPFAGVPRIYNLTAPTDFAAGPSVGFQLVLKTPLTSSTLNTSRVALQERNGTFGYYDAFDWINPLPELVQALLIESFENSGKLTAVDRESTGLRSDYVLLTDIRDFQAEYLVGDVKNTAPSARIRLHAKLVKMPRRVIVASQTFEASVPAVGTSVVDIVNSFDEAFHQVAARLVEWAVAPGRKEGGA